MTRNDMRITHKTHAKQRKTAREIARNSCEIPAYPRVNFLHTFAPPRANGNPVRYESGIYPPITHHSKVTVTLTTRKNFGIMPNCHALPQTPARRGDRHTNMRAGHA